VKHRPAPFTCCDAAAMSIAQEKSRPGSSCRSFWPSACVIFCTFRRSRHRLKDQETKIDQNYAALEKTGQLNHKYKRSNARFPSAGDGGTRVIRSRLTGWSSFAK
jgi:hypothetical protein